MEFLDLLKNGEFKGQCRELLNHDLLQRDANCEFSWKAWNELSNLGVLRASVPKKYNGLELPLKEMISIYSELAEGSLDLGFTFSYMVQGILATNLLLQYGTEEQKDKYLEKIMNGSYVVSICNAEEGTGTNIAKMLSSYQIKNDAVTLNAKKHVCTNTPNGNLFFVSAKNANDPEKISIFIVEENDVMQKSHIKDLLGMRTGLTGEIEIQNKEIGKFSEVCLGSEGIGGSVLQRCFDLDRLFLSAIALGCLKGITQLAVLFIFNRAIKDATFSNHQYIQEKVINLITLTEMIEGMLSKIIMNNLDKPALDLASNRQTLGVLKMLLCEKFSDNTFRLLELMGYPGCQLTNNIQKVIRDPIHFKFLGGTTELQKNMLFASYFKQSTKNLKID